MATGTIKKPVEAELNRMTGRTLLATISSPVANTNYNLSDNVQNYDSVEIIVKKSGATGAFMSRSINHDDVGIGSSDDISLTAYNSASYNAYIECGFGNGTIFRMSTLRMTGWTLTPIYIVGVGKRT